MIEIVFLGTATMSPTKERNHQAIFLKYLNNRMLFDCGENTQRQLTLAGISGFKIQNIFISHLHADHLIGLGGMIQSLNALGRLEELHIFGPKGIQEISFSNKTLLFKVKTSSGVNDVFYETIPQIVGSLPSKNGDYYISLTAEQGYVNVSVV